MSSGPAFRVRPGIGWTHTTTAEGDVVHVAPLPNGPVAVLPDQSAAIWLAAVDGSGDVVADVAEMTGHEAAVVRDDVAAFLNELVDRGLLRPA